MKDWWYENVPINQVIIYMRNKHYESHKRERVEKWYKVEYKIKYTYMIGVLKGSNWAYLVVIKQCMSRCRLICSNVEKFNEYTE